MGKFTEILERIKLDEMSMGDAVRAFQDEGVEPASLSKAELKTAWRKLQRKYHPDRGGDPQKAQAINQAYDILVGRTSQGRRASRTSEPPPSSGPQYGFRGAEYTQDYAAGQYGRTARMDMPEWQTDKRSTYNKINREDYTDVNFIKKDMWEKSGKSKEEWTIHGFDGRFFRGTTTVYGNKEIFNDMAEAMATWQSKGGNPYPTRAVFVSPRRGNKLYLVYLDGKFMGDDPYVFEHDSPNMNPSNDQSFVRNLPDKLDKISTKKEDVGNVAENASAGAVGAGAISSLAASVGNRSRNQKSNRGKKKETIFAVSAEDEGNVVRMGGERKSPDQFSPQEITVLRNRYAKIDKIDPLSPSYEKLTDMLDNASDELLKQLAGADIKFVSKLAKNRVIRRGMAEEIAAIRKRAGLIED